MSSPPVDSDSTTGEGGHPEALGRVLADGPPGCETPLQALLQTVVRRVGLGAKRVQQLAEEAAGGGGRGDVEDLGVGEAVLAKRTHVVLGDCAGIAGELLGERHHRQLGRAQGGGVRIVGDGCHLLERVELLKKDAAVGQHAVRAAQGPGRGERHQLVPTRIEMAADADQQA
jgi:hypothetical protein